MLYIIYITDIITDYPLRNSNLFTTIKCRTERYRCRFFPSTIALLNNGKLI